MSRQAEFVALGEHGERFYTRKGVQIAFAERLAAVWEDDGPSSHAAVVSLPELRTGFAGHLADPDATWLLPLLDRLEAGEDAAALRAEAIAQYVAHHGREPERITWQVRD